MAVEILATNEVEWDLRDGLSREDVGMPEGRRIIPIGHSTGKPLINVRLQLPEGEFEADVAAIHVEADSETVTLLSLVRDLESADEVYEQLLVEVDRLGLPIESVERWYANNSNMFDPGAVYTTRVFSSDAVGMLTAVELANPGVDNAPVLTYQFHLVDPFADDEPDTATP